MPAIAARTDDLTAELCERFTQVTGWPLRYAAATADFEAQQDRLDRDAGCRWYSAIGDGSRPTGILQLHGTDEGTQRVELHEAVGMAETLAGLLGRLTAAGAQLSLRNKDVAALLNLGVAIPAQDDLAFGLSQLLKAATHLTGSRSAAFFLLDPPTKRLNLRAAYQLTREEMPHAERALRSSPADMRALAEGPVVLGCAAPGGNPLFPPSMRHAMVAAVQSEDVPFGTLWVYERRSKEYTRRDMHVLQSIAAQIAATLERSALLRGDRQQERLCRDVKAASDSHNDGYLQDLPNDSRFELAARCASCYELGGDLCEVLPVAPHRTAIAIGDASGNSIPAAMIMSSVRGALLTHPADEPDVAALLTKVNAGLCRITRSHQFMSLCYGVYDAENWRFTYCNAGHPSPLLVRDGHVSVLESHGLLLGVLDETTYPQSTLQLDRGDLLILYSDGVNEAHGADHQLFRTEGIVAAVREALGGTAQHVLHTIWDRVDRHLGSGEPGDDRTLIVLRIVGD